MKLVVVSHACVTPVNQSFYADVEKLTGWTIDLVLPARWKNEYSSQIAPARWPGLKAEMHLTPVWKPGSVPLHLYQSWFAGMFNKIRPDAIYVHHEPYGLATAQVYLANALTARAPIGFYAAQNINKTYPRLFRTIEKAIYRRSGFCFPVTQGALSVLREKGYQGPAQVLPLAIDSNVYRPRPSEAAALRHELGIQPEEYVIGYLGRLVEEKGLETLVRSLARITHPAWRCVLAGSGPYEARIKELAIETGLEDKILFAGYVKHEDAPVWLSLFDVLALPSETRAHWKEQFGRVLLEANACGTPVIGTECGEIPAVIRDTSGGLIVPEADPSALASAIESLVADRAQRAQLASAGQQAVTDRYSQPYIASVFTRAIEQAVTSARSAR